MVVNSTLLGRTEMIISGQLTVELGNTAFDSDYIPIVIRKGQTLYGAPLEALLGGEIPTGLETGTIVVSVLTDAYGYLESSERLFGIDGSQVSLSFLLDVAVTTTEAKANAQMGQLILGIPLDGTARVLDGGVLFMEAAGFASMNVLGEAMGVTISLSMQPPIGEIDSAPDTNGPQLVSAAPPSGGNEGAARRSGHHEFFETAGAGHAGRERANANRGRVRGARQSRAEGQ
ncbi:MAG: hypothetical protein M5R36_19760 [Deltaproteobacteria bacterium]|nr:hypothetical protein [Deltaproteobacteria bacterium]